MISRLPSGWQIVLADLSLVLFLATAAALEASDGEEFMFMAPEADAVAVYREGAGRSLSDWLAERPRDPRERLTVLARHVPGTRNEAMKGALELAEEAEEAGRPARIVLEPAAQAETVALIGFAGEDGVASGT